MIEEHNRTAGQGAVVLDIGGNVGALLVDAPASLAGVELEVRPASGSAGTSPTHVAVLPRPTGRGVVHSAVFAALPAGRYELRRLPDGSAALEVTVVGGRVQRASWPAGR